ncbi:MAG: glucokinase, partial [Nitrosomonas sp.]|nr:glucokinase [Nitrosomonas sp.]
MNKQLIYGDIGGTKTILQMAEITAGGQLHERCTQRYDSTVFAAFSGMLEAFLKQTAASNPPAAACFAVAGPIADQQST